MRTRGGYEALLSYMNVTFSISICQKHQTDSEKLTKSDTGQTQNRLTLTKSADSEGLVQYRTDTDSQREVRHRTLTASPTQTDSERLTKSDTLDRHRQQEADGDT